jgi:uncharacterized membrane protein
MKKLRIFATITTVLGYLSVLSLIFLFLALSDIAHQEEDLTLEWHITGICIINLSAFTISTFVTLGFLFKSAGKWDDTGSSFRRLKGRQ